MEQKFCVIPRGRPLSPSVRADASSLAKSRLVPQTEESTIELKNINYI